MVPLSGEEKGAWLLKNLAPDLVDKILAQVSPERGGRLRALMSKLQPGPEMDEMLLTLWKELQDYQTKKAGKPTLSVVSQDYAMPVRENKEPPPAAKPPAPPGDPADPLVALSQLPPERLALVLDGEDAKTVSLIFNYLEVDLAGSVFKFLPAALRTEVSVQFSQQAAPTLAVLRRIADALLRKNQRLVEKPVFAEGTARFRKMADMLRLLDKDEKQQVLETLQKKDPAAAGQIKAMLYRFEDILRLDNRAMQKILMDTDAKSLGLALRGAEDNLKDKILTNLSKRAQENLIEEMEMNNSISKDQTEQARAAITQIIQQLDLAGEIVLQD